MSAGTLYHIAFSVDLSDPAKRHVYINRTAETMSWDTYFDNGIGADATAATITWFNNIDATLLLKADAGHLYSAPGQYLDISNVTNLNKFIDTGGEAVDLGADGSTPTGVAPLMYFKGAAATFHTNLGTGGAFSVAGGTITDTALELSGDENPTGEVSDDNNVAGVLKRLLLDGGVPENNIVLADVDQLDADAGYVTGIIVRTQTYREAIDAIRVGAAAWVAPNRLGQYNMRQIQDPSGTPAATFRLFEYPNVAGLNDFAIKKLERLVSNDEGRGVPTWQITVNYLRMWAVQSGDELAGSVTEADKAKYSREYRSVTVEDSTIKNQFPLAGTLTVDTLLTTEADAQALADHLLSLFGVRRDLFRLKASYDVPLAGAVDLGDVVKVYHPRFGLSGGRLFNVHGIQYDARKFDLELELWG